MPLAETLESRRKVAANLFEYFFGGGVADMRRMPAATTWAMIDCFLQEAVQLR